MGSYGDGQAIVGDQCSLTSHAGQPLALLGVLQSLLLVYWHHVNQTCVLLGLVQPCHVVLKDRIHVPADGETGSLYKNMQVM